jgi:hypothetical protein
MDENDPRRSTDINDININYIKLENIVIRKPTFKQRQTANFNFYVSNDANKCVVNNDTNKYVNNDTDEYINDANKCNDAAIQLRRIPTELLRSTERDSDDVILEVDRADLVEAALKRTESGADLVQTGNGARGKSLLQVERIHSVRFGLFR